jgi:PfaD family protein
LPPVYPEWLGDRSFQETHRTRFAYVGGEMANGIATERMVIELARAGCLGFFGAAGLALSRVEAAVDLLARTLDPEGLPWGINLIHSPDEPDLEMGLADLFLRRGVQRVSASAFMRLAPAIVRYSAAGLSRAADGTIERSTHVFAKISRPEVARAFLSPAPAAVLEALVAAGQLSAEQASLARLVPVAADVTFEADSGGHTDNRPLAAMFPVLAQLRDELAAEHRFAEPPRLGAAGGLGTPHAVAAAFALGAAYVVVGSVHQACVESGVSDAARELLARAGPADMAMTAAGDMFEQGVKVQVLRRGTQMPQRGNQLYTLYRRHNAWEEIPAAERADLEENVLGQSFASAWAATRDYLERKGDKAELARCEADPKARLARVFKRYLGLTARWPLAEGGDATRRLHFQLWCGPAMGAFNEWSRGTFLAAPEARTVRQVALNFLEGAALVARAQQLRACGVPVPPAWFAPRPEPLAL